MLDLGTYEYVQRVYNQNMRLDQYKLPQKLDDGNKIPIDDGLIKMMLEINNQRVNKITITTTNPRSSEYMQVFEGFEFGFDAVSTWIQNYQESVSKHTSSSGVVKGIRADYLTNDKNVLTVSLVRVANK